MGKFKHGKCGTRAYYCWRNMLNRCGWNKGPDFKNYGARGIKICERWMRFENFYADMGDPPPGLTLERKDNSKGYSKDNCIWDTRAEQSKNRRNTRWLTFEGRTLHLSEWARIKGIKITTLKMRLDHYGWPLERALCE